MTAKKDDLPKAEAAQKANQEARQELTEYAIKQGGNLGIEPDLGTASLRFTTHFYEKSGTFQGREIASAYLGLVIQNTEIAENADRVKAMIDAAAKVAEEHEKNGAEAAQKLVAKTKVASAAAPKDD